MKRLTQWIMIPVLAALLTACGGETPPATSLPATPPPAPPTATRVPPPLPTDESGQPLAARVNGEPITQAAFERALARSAQSSTAADPRALAGAVLDTMIEQMLIAQAAPALGVSVSEAEIDADVAEMTRLAGSPEAWAQWQLSNLYTEQEYRDATRTQLLTFRVRDAIAAQDSDAGTVPQVRARHILVATEAEAQDVLRRLQAGERFETLAAARSRDVTTRDRGGDLGFFIRENLTTPELADLAFSLQAGEVGGPVRTMLGYHVVQTLEFASAPPSDADFALQAEARFADWLHEQRSSATIEIYLD